MRRHLVHFASALVALMFAMPALAAPGLKLSWDHCSADGRISNRAFACDTNAGSELLVLSFEPALDKPDVTGFEITMHLKSSAASLPDWWRFASGACRVTGMTSDFSPAVAGSCEYPLSTNAAGGIATFQADSFGPGSLRILAVSAVPVQDQFAIAPGHEYFVFAFVLRNIRTVGTGACPGCSTPMCIGFGSVKAVGPTGTSDMSVLAGGPNAGGSEETVTWQGAYVRDYTVFRDGVALVASMTCDPDNTVPTRRSTWGLVKSLYR